ncbi:PDZ domain-containing protein [Gordonia sp. ABSL1-1]|uniref:YlbL family protein n=1 Tax=Gordonia sp. ABSL1-1 TaxID=3053923 RepID=UPI00257311A4|nr:PDZ domain-containing protein [Gordonia sp. ABSL1-1]MDL9936806.1 PDZ domain-containing protein [Gordonia sp. ABSL1-1]
MRSQADIRRIATIGVTTLVLIGLLLLGTMAQVPFVAMGPGPTVNTLGDVDVAMPDGKVVSKPVIQIEGAPVDPTTGNLNLTTVAVSDGLSLFEAIGRWVQGDYALQPRERVYPSDRSTEDVHRENAALMSSSEENATLAALHFLGKTKLVVGSVSKGGPSDGVLRVDDQIVRVAGTPVNERAAAVELLKRAGAGKPVAVDVIRGGTPTTVTVVPAATGENGTPQLGIGLTLRNADPALKITFTVGDIGGPSAGLMMSLAVVDKLSTGELTGGKFVAGTGTIDPDGDVGVIGGITHKTRAARDAGATVFLVPEGNCAEAASDRPDGLELVKVSTLNGAVDSLNTITRGGQVPHC